MDRNGAKSFFDKCSHLAVAGFSKLSKLFDKIIYHKRSSVIVSLLVSTGICVAVNFDDIRYTFFNNDLTTLNVPGVGVEIKADTETYEITGVPSTVDLTLTGDPADIQSFRNQSNAAVVTADLRNFGEGDNVATLQVSNVPKQIDVQVNPATVEVDLVRKLTKSFPVDAELLIGIGQKKSDFDSVTPAQSSVLVKATQEQLDSIRKVEAIVDTTGKTTDFSMNAPLVAYDSNGDKVNVEINPTTVEVAVKVKTTNTNEKE